MKDRVPTYPGRVTLTPVSGNTYDMVMADEPTEVGTPPTKVNLLTDATAEMIWNDPLSRPANPTVNLALAKLSGGGAIEETVPALSSIAKFDPINVTGGAAWKPLSGAKGSNAVSYSGQSSVQPHDLAFLWVSDDTFIACGRDYSASTSPVARTYSVAANGTISEKTNFNFGSPSGKGFVNVVKLRDGVAVAFYLNANSRLSYAIIDCTKNDASSQYPSLTQMAAITGTKYAMTCLPIVIDENTILLYCQDNNVAGATPTNSAFTFMTIPDDISAQTPTATFTPYVPTSPNVVFDKVAKIRDGKALFMVGGQAKCAVCTYDSSTATLGAITTLSASGSQHSTVLEQIANGELIYARIYSPTNTDGVYTYYHISVATDDTVTIDAGTAVTVTYSDYRIRYINGTYIAKSGDVVVPLIDSVGKFSFLLYNVHSNTHKIIADSSDTAYTTYTASVPTCYGGDEKGLIIYEQTGSSARAVIRFALALGGNMAIAGNAANAGENVRAIYHGTIADSDITREMSIVTDGVVAFAPIAGKMHVNGYWLNNNN